MGTQAKTDPAAEAMRAMAEGADAWRAGRIEAALGAFARASLLAPGLPSAHLNLGVALRRLGRVEAAIAAYQRGLALSPDDPALHSNLGNALREAGRLEEAEAHQRRAVTAKPADPGYRYNLALVLRDRRRHAEARAMLAALTAENPDNGEVAWDLALSDLYLRDYRNGFAGYEARWRLARARLRQLPTPRWLPGADIAGKTVLVTSEQGFGDSLQFARFLPKLARRGARVVVECLPELAPLFATLPAVEVVSGGNPLPGHDLWTPIMSLAWLLGVDHHALPAGPVPYLTAPSNPALMLGRPPGTRLNVGLVWAGKTSPRDRSWPLARLFPLFEDPRVAFWSLQMGERAGDLKATGALALVRDLSPRIGSFADTATLMAQMDLIITIDTSAAHLAGALGRPTWVLLRHVSDWRWGDEDDTSAWYPSLRLFRQADPDDFAGPVARVRAELAALMAGRG